MRFIYVDPGLRDYRGHHPQSCRLIVGELRRRGIDTRVFSSINIDPALREEFAATALFRIHPYQFTDGDPICGWLTFFHNAATITSDDLEGIPDIGTDDVLYINSAQPVQLMALTQWALRRRPEQRPRIMIEFGTGPGLDVVFTQVGRTLRLPDVRVDARHARPILYRYIAKHLSEFHPEQFHVIAYDRGPAEVYRELLGRPVHVLPQRHTATTILRNRSRESPITVSVLGHQQPAKGFNLMPEIAAELLRRISDIRILVHNSDPAWLAEPHRRLVSLADKDERLIIDDAAGGEVKWNELLEASDLILCPYDPSHYALSESSIVGDAVANGIPTIVPANTAPARLISEFGNPGVVFSEWSADSIVEATISALGDFDDLANRAYHAAVQWPELHGPGHLVDALLSLPAHFGIGST